MQTCDCAFFRKTITAMLMLLALSTAAFAAPVLMISVDGMKPESVLDADAKGLKVPYLRSLVSQGAYADGVIGVCPTNTYPSHTIFGHGSRTGRAWHLY